MILIILFFNNAYKFDNTQWNNYPTLGPLKIIMIEIFCWPIEYNNKNIIWLNTIISNNKGN